jgi:hypothetical protein
MVKRDAAVDRRRLSLLLGRYLVWHVGRLPSIDMALVNDG